MPDRAYHALPQPYRIQKRLALNQCFRAIQSGWPGQKRIGYVTFGGEDLYDTMDLIGVFSVRDHEISIVSYEQNIERAETSRNCAVAATLSQVPSITIDIVAAPFPTVMERVEAIRRDRQLIFFLDYTGTFRDKEANDLEFLLDAGLLQVDDFLLITSCLTPRVVHNSSLMAKYDRSFQLLFRPKRLDGEFRGRNHVDLLVELAFSRRERKVRDIGGDIIPSATLLRKFRYRDSRSPMGLWLYRIDLKKLRRHLTLQEVPFDEFPHAFTKSREPEVPNIFD